MPDISDPACNKACHDYWDWRAFPELFPNPERLEKIGDRGCTVERPCTPWFDLDAFIENPLAGTIFDTSPDKNPLSGTIFDTSSGPGADPLAGTIFETTPGKATAPQPKAPKGDPAPAADDIGDWDSGYDPYNPSPAGEDAPTGGASSFEKWLRGLLEE
jgi:hypothetical protein